MASKHVGLSDGKEVLLSYLPLNHVAAQVSEFHVEFCSVSHAFIIFVSCFQGLLIAISAPV